MSYTFAQTHKMYNTKSEPQGKLGTLCNYDVCRFSSTARNVPSGGIC